jgi:hypothetical protein
MAVDPQFATMVHAIHGQHPVIGHEPNMQGAHADAIDSQVPLLIHRPNAIAHDVHRIILVDNHTGYIRC